MTRPPTATTENVYVLIVDDDHDDYLILDSLLQQVGSYTTDWAPTFTVGLERLNSKTFDAVLVDHHLGARDDLDLLASTQTAATPLN